MTHLIPSLRTVFLATFLIGASAADAQDAAGPSGLGVILQQAGRFSGDSHVIVLIRRVSDADAIPTGEALAARFDATLEASVPLPSVEETCYVIRVREGDDPAAVGEALAAEADVLASYPMQVFTTEQSRAPDPYRPAQHGLASLGLAAVPPGARGAGVRVALIDTGVETGHPDLSAQSVRSVDFVRDGRVGGERHGTALASVIVADDDNGVGMAGVAPDATLLALRGCWEEGGPGPDGVGRCNTITLGLALDHAVSQRTNVVNLSLSGPSDPLLANIIGAAQEAGALVIAADGSDGGGGFPAEVPGVLTAAGAAGAADLAAPGDEILAATPDGDWDFVSGPSVSAAHASGIAALLWSTAPEVSPDTVRHALGAPGGALDACAALEALDGGTTCD